MFLWYLIDGCIWTWGSRRQEGSAVWKAAHLPSICGAVTHITLAKYIGMDMLEHLWLCDVKEAFAAGFGLTSFEIFPGFSEVLLYFPSFRRCQKGNKTWEVASAYRILIIIHFCVLHVQVSTWAQSGEQLPVSPYIADWSYGVSRHSDHRAQAAQVMAKNETSQ